MCAGLGPHSWQPMIDSFHSDHHEPAVTLRPGWMAIVWGMPAYSPTFLSFGCLPVSAGNPLGHGGVVVWIYALRELGRHLGPVFPLS